MRGEVLLDFMAQHGRRTARVGTSENGVIAGLDLEGRLFAVVEGRVLHRVFPEAIRQRSDRRQFWNPGGDALWPGPEGTCFGYEYGTGDWRVPPSISGAVWLVREQSRNRLVIEAEVDLINSRQLGIPVLLRRDISVAFAPKRLTVRVTESIRYLGARTLEANEFSLIPWSLCQFDWTAGCHYRFALAGPCDVWDFYAPSDGQRSVREGVCVVKAETRERFQLGIGESVPWVEYVYPDEFWVRRYLDGPICGRFADIADAPPTEFPSNRGTKLSVYCDPSGFTEIEACGGTLERLSTGDESSVTIVTDYHLNDRTNNVE